MSNPSAHSEALPSTQALSRASLAFAILAAFLTLGVVVPAETGKDPLGVGAVIGLTEMGRIKVALAREQAAESANVALDIGRASSSNARASANGPSGGWRDSLSVSLSPNQGIELKLVMQKGQRSHFEWKADSAEVYFNRHGEPLDAPKDAPPHSYGKGMARADSGEIVAVFDGLHGWFFRNRSGQTVHVTLKTRGEYDVLKALK